MNILTDELPTTLQVGPTEYPINSDFRVCLKIILAFEDNDLTPQEKTIILLSSLFGEIPADMPTAIDRAQWFLNGGQVDECESDTESVRLYSFAKDANFIFAAFKQTHGIDLQTADLHWWKFLALFMDLGQDTTFCQLVSLRKRIKTGKATKEERAAAHEMGNVLDVPEVDTRTLDEKEREAEFMRLVAQGYTKDAI